MRRRKTDEQIAAERHKRRTVAIGCTAGAVVVVGLGTWLAYEGLQAKSSLEQARDYATSSKEALLAGDTETALRTAGDADKYAKQAQDSTHSLPWNIAAAIPWLGSPFASSQQMSDVVTGLTSDVLVPAVDAGSAVSPDQLILDGARINLAALRDAAPVLETTAAAAAELDARAQNIDGTYLGPIDDARVQLQDQTAELSGLLHNTSLAAEIAPAMLGADGPRSYFIGFQTNAEARGTGGLLGGFGIVRATGGVVRVDDISRRDFMGPFQPIDLGPDFQRTYGHSQPTTRAVNSNVSSHFPYAAQIWQSLWLQESGERVDGAVATDPVALSYVLEVVGPVILQDGEKITADNVVELTESNAYSRFGDNQAARKQYLERVASAVVQKMTGSISRPQALLEALGRAAGEGRLAVWSANPDEQAVLADTPLGHTVPDDPAPYAGVVVNNLGGNKLDYHLRREIEYTASSCRGDTRTSTVAVRLTNDLPAGNFTNYVAGMFDNPVGAPFGSNLTDLSLVATRGAKLDKVTVNGTAAMSFTGRELGHPVYSVQFAIPRGETVEVVFELTEPTAGGEATVPVQPLVDEPKVSAEVPVCD
ncbi:DUF4012 domain-containing protein [Rhodococcus aetherivorans]|uniref:DUF4012 domain-containing protein n=1 Tax=Rhodococcus aetherivorans TaxID=191292 RepID=A0AA46NYK9_9NOCA|nr:MULTISPECIES: DUF4012 domain-containing protein [Rhodococcus]USC18346.1 DUF4012 domain-containing protein [Rhodococcus sp. 11-3]UYF96824.1 DUF4012 domain-containing protein [Rhodococcus aetherivorans]